MDSSLNLSYSPKVLKLLENPKNMGEIKDADGVGMVGNPVCGDIMKVYIKVGKKKGGLAYLKDVKFQTLGCGAAIATSSMVTTLAKGRTLEAAQKISKEEIAQELGGLPKIKFHCSVLADEALQKAIEDYLSKKN